MNKSTNSTAVIGRTRLSLTVGAVVFLTLAGAGMAQANWTTSAVTTEGAVTSGALSVTSAPAGVDNTYTSSNLSFTRAITVSNTSGIAAAPGLTFTAGSGQTLASGSVGVEAASVKIWVPTGGTCNTVPPGAFVSWVDAQATGSQVPALSGGETYCLNSSLTLPQRYSLVGTSAAITSTARVVRGYWLAIATSTFTQSVANTITPGTPTVSGTPTTSSITINWTAPADAVGIAGYYVYRNGSETPVGTITDPAARTFTDTALTAGTSYSYTVKGFVNGTVAAPSGTGKTTSPASNGLTVSTKAAVIVPPTGNLVPVVNDGLCLEGKNGQMKFATCGSGAQFSWKLAAATTSNGRAAYTIQSQQFSDFLNADTTTNVRLKGMPFTDTQKWIAIPDGTQFRFENASNGRCLNNNGGQLDLAVCAAGSAAQKITLGAN